MVLLVTVFRWNVNIRKVYYLVLCRGFHFKQHMSQGGHLVLIRTKSSFLVYFKANLGWTCQFLRDKWRSCRFKVWLLIMPSSGNPTNSRCQQLCQLHIGSLRYTMTSSKIFNIIDVIGVILGYLDASEFQCRLDWVRRSREKRIFFRQKRKFNFEVETCKKVWKNRGEKKRNFVLPPFPSIFIFCQSVFNDLWFLPER